jgi:protein-disulfide isomerase
MKNFNLYQKIFFISLFIFLNLNNSIVYGNDTIKVISLGEETAPVKIKVFSSFTCPHCANFHLNVIPKIIDNYVKKGHVEILFIDFPHDLAALSASKMVHCVSKSNQMNVMNLIYEKQKEWGVGGTIEEVNSSLIKIITTTGVKSEKIENCLKNDKIENKVLNDRIEGHKKYSISSTPTIIINEKKHKGTNTFKEIEEIIKKNI